jgi:hypothetical protein
MSPRVGRPGPSDLMRPKMSYQHDVLFVLHKNSIGPNARVGSVNGLTNSVKPQFRTIRVQRNELCLLRAYTLLVFCSGYEDIVGDRG